MNEFLNDAAIEWVRIFVPILMLAGLRYGVMLVSLPAPFGNLAPQTVRAALSVLLALATVLPLQSELIPVRLEALFLLRAAVGEVLIGGLIGLSARVTLVAAEIAGTIAGFSMGLGFASSIDPMYGESSLPTTKLLGSLAALLFLLLGGHHILLTAVSHSLSVAPPGYVFSHADFHFEGIVLLGGSMISAGLRIAAPVVATMFILQLGLGLVSRSAPKVQIFALSFAFATAGGTITLLLAAPSMAAAVSDRIGELPRTIASLIG